MAASQVTEKKGVWHWRAERMRKNAERLSDKAAAAMAVAERAFAALEEPVHDMPLLRETLAWPGPNASRGEA